MMEKDPAKRVQTCSDVVTRLEPWAIQAGQIYSQTETKPFWMPPPLPTHNYGDVENERTSEDESGSASQWSQGTASGSLHQETLRSRLAGAPPLTLSYPRPPIRELNLSFALIISGLSLLAGVAIGFALGVWWYLADKQ